VILATHTGKTCASQKRRGSQKILTLSPASRRRTEGPAGFRRSVPKIPRCGSAHCRPPATSRWTWLSDVTFPHASASSRVYPGRDSRARGTWSRPHPRHFCGRDDSALAFPGVLDRVRRLEDVQRTAALYRATPHADPGPELLERIQAAL